MRSMENNPFIHDVERQDPRRSSRAWIWQIIAWQSFGTVLISIFCIIAFLYVIMISMGFGHKKSYDANHPVTRLPATEAPITITGTMNWTSSTWTTPTWIMQNWTNLDWTTQSGTTSNRTPAIPELSTSEFVVKTSQIEPTIATLNGSLPLTGSSVYPEDSLPSLCMPQMKQEEFHEKLWICHQCWHGNYSASFMTEVAHNRFCHNKCFDNAIYKQCANTLEMIVLLQAA